MFKFLAWHRSIIPFPQAIREEFCQRLADELPFRLAEEVGRSSLGLEGGRDADQPYYAMDYVAGVDLKRYLSAARPELHTTLGMFERICEAVGYAHDHGVIHRDLKPANVLSTMRGTRTSWTSAWPRPRIGPAQTRA